MDGRRRRWNRDANTWEERRQQWQTDDSRGHNQGGCSRGWNDWIHEEGVKPGMGGKMMGGKVGQATKKLQDPMLVQSTESGALDGAKAVR